MMKADGGPPAGVSRSEQAALPGVWLACFSRTAAGSVTGFATDLRGSAAGNGRGALTLRDGPGDSSPGTAADASCCVVFDGVLYNRNELRQRFKGSLAPVGDAGLVLHAYRRWGEGVFKELKGIFALLIWDSEQDVLLGARDPLGVYPLFRADVGGDVLFSTSITALVRHPHVCATVNRVALADQLCHRWHDPEETFFAQVRRIPPGFALRINGRGRETYRYWDPLPPGASVDWIDEEESAQFDVLLDQAVDRCQQLGPSGIYLSGGLDSVSVAAVAAENSRRNGMASPWALSLVFPDPDVNEESIQTSVARALGLPQVLAPFDEAVGPKGLLPASLEMSGNWSVPLVNPWSPAYFALGGEGKRRGCQVLLTGGGGDEWLGVSPLLAADLIRTLDVQGLYRLWGTMRRSYQAPHLTLLRNVLWRFGARPLLSSVTGRALRRLAPGTLEARRFRRISAGRPAWIAPDPTLAREMDDRIRQSVEHGVRDLRSSEFYLREMRLAFTHPLTSMEMEEQFEFGQRMGVRLMMPYWDADLVGMLYRVPPHLLSKGGRSKGLVRQSLARRFPQLGFERQKKVIATNFFRSTLLAQGPEALRGLGGTPCLSELGIVEDKGLHATMEGIFSGEGSRRAYHIWDVLNLEAWLRTHL